MFSKFYAPFLVAGIGAAGDGWRCDRRCSCACRGGRRGRCRCGAGGGPAIGRAARMQQLTVGGSGGGGAVLVSRRFGRIPRHNHDRTAGAAAAAGCRRRCRRRRCRRGGRLHFVDGGAEMRQAGDFIGAGISSRPNGNGNVDSV